MYRKVLAVTALASLCLFQPLAAQEEPAKVDMAEMMAKMQEMTAPSTHHKQLERFLGEWDTTTTILMPGMEHEPEKGIAVFDWLVDGRWLRQTAETQLLGMPSEIHSTMGYDNFKQSFVSMQVTSMDTAMLTLEGDMDPSGDALLLYGTVDEYLTGAHDKMVKGIWRFPNDNQLVLEIHDFTIGETGTKVAETIYTRRNPKD